MMQDFMQVGIIIPAGKISQEEIKNLVKREEVASLALKRFLAAQISFRDYLEILELCKVDIDDYLETVENNCVGF